MSTPRYIDAEQIEYNYKYGNVMFFAQKEQIDEIPTADVAPVVHAKWVGLAYDFLGGKFVYACSRCDRQIKIYHREDFKDFPYCHCGAKMDKEDNND